MQTIRYTLTALGPVSHGDMGSGDTGNVMLFRRIPRIHDGVPVGVPAISAGSLRGIVRRLLWREAFEAVGLSRETYDGPGSWDRLYAALCNGGTIEAAEKRVDPGVIRERRRTMPILSLLGAALYQSYMAGDARVSNAWLRCIESGHEGAPSMWDLIAEESRVRHVDSEEQNPDESSVGPMPTTIETVITGAEFTGHAAIHGDLEVSAWAHGLDLVRYVGGKAAAGFGEVEITHDGDGSAYMAWLDAHRDELRAALLKLGGELTPGKAPKAKKSPKAASNDEAVLF